MVIEVYPVADDQRSPQSNVVSLEGAAPSDAIHPDEAFDDSPIVRAGREAWQKEKDLRGEQRRSRERVYQMADAINKGQQWALDKAHTDNPRTKACREFFNHWLQVNGFADIDGCPGRDDKKGSGDFGRLKRLAEPAVREVVETYLATLPESKRDRYNSPSALWRAYACKDRCNRGRPKDEAPPPPPGVDPHEAQALELAYHVQREVAKIDPRIPFTAGTRANLLEASDALRLLADAGLKQAEAA